MRRIIAALAFLLQAQPLPTPFDREGATKLLENNQVIVWDVSWLQQAYPTHRHIYDYAGVYYTSGDRVVVSDRGVRSPTTSTAWDTFFFRRGVTHSEEGASKDPLRAVFVEFKQPGPSGLASASESASVFPAAPGKQVRESERVVIWAFAPTPDARPTTHYHVRDAVVVTFGQSKPHVTFVAHGATDNEQHAPAADQTYVFELK